MSLGMPFRFHEVDYRLRQIPDRRPRGGADLAVNLELYFQKMKYIKCLEKLSQYCLPFSQNDLRADVTS
jgi:hypothetical protein